MATRRPIVMVAGRLKELPVGDTVEGTTASGSVDSVTSTVPQVSHGFAVGMPIYRGSSNWLVSDCDSDTTMCEAFVSAVDGPNAFTLTQVGVVTLLTAEWDARTGDIGGLTAGEYYWLSTTSGGITKTQPISGFAQCVGKAESATVLRVAIGPVIDLGSGTGTAKRVTRVTHNVSQNIAIPSGYKTILFNTVVTDPFSQWNAAGNRFICQVAGYYFCTFTNAGPSGGDGTPAFSVNGTANYNGTDMTDIFNSCTTRLIYLNVGDYVQAQIYITANRAVAAPTLEIVGPL